MIEDFHIEIVKYKVGIHHFSLAADNSFFAHFSNPLVLKSNVIVDVELEKHNNWINVNYLAHGNIQATCDRCLVPIEFSINTNYRIVFKTAIDETQEDEDDVKYIKPHHTYINIGDSVYETILLDLPMAKNCDELDTKPCDLKILNKLGETEEKQEIDPRWEKLKEIKTKK